MASVLVTDTGADTCNKAPSQPRGGRHGHSAQGLTHQKPPRVFRRIASTGVSDGVREVSRLIGTKIKQIAEKRPSIPGVSFGFCVRGERVDSVSFEKETF